LSPLKTIYPVLRRSDYIVKLPEFKEFNDYYEKNPPEILIDDTGIRHQNEVLLPSKYKKAPCKCDIVHEISSGSWYHSFLGFFKDLNIPNSIKIVKKCKNCHQILFLKMEE
jgi:hypothetical protein